MTLSFAISYAALCAAQGGTVAVPAPERFRWLDRLRSRWWALVPLAAIVGTVAAVGAAAGSADVLTWLALLTTPPLAMVALGYAMKGARPALALLVLPLCAAAWLSRETLVGEAAALVLIGAACVTLAALLAAVAPDLWLKVGLLLFAATDTWLVADKLLQHPNAVLSAAAPGGGLPQLQRVSLGSAEMGYGDLFAAALLGALLARQRPRQLRGAALTTLLALAFGLLFFVVHTLPATVPVAAALVALELGAIERGEGRRPMPRAGSRARAPHPGPSRRTRRARRSGPRGGAARWRA
ncbi:MAG: hypothetical protein QOC77_2737 [Thermoleophilaceae bacterium]|nr:hypothetical protein [Thermoleophilaceae bacterium]